MDDHSAPPSDRDEGYPSWLDRTRYPFASRRFDSSDGTLHVLDEGEGRPVVMLHGNPTWSFLYRHLVGGLSDEFRCIAPDLLGFGLSDRLRDDSAGRPAAHARTVERLFEEFELRDAVILGHDWGGPLGMDVATRNPESVAGLVMTNTWTWPRRDLFPRAFGRLVGTSAGKRFVVRHNAFARTALGGPALLRSSFERSAYRHYAAPLATPSDRVGSWVLLRELVESNDWLGELWNRRAAVAGTPTLLLWGMRDPIHAPFLRRWRALFPNASAVTYDGAGHFVPEEVGAGLVPPVREFLRDL
ncbi:alpha/beta fold hydrolase [Halopelagius fulvigenes]|uniref:Alpha/beta fold hydrolase n=1 Tax=Halopelagius fulvigenes TaxID=1198324 RepID=A0ABD5TZ59_9EURY